MRPSGGCPRSYDADATDDRKQRTNHKGRRHVDDHSPHRKREILLIAKRMGHHSAVAYRPEKNAVQWLGTRTVVEEQVTVRLCPTTRNLENPFTATHSHRPALDGLPESDKHRFSSATALAWSWLEHSGLPTSSTCSPHRAGSSTRHALQRYSFK